LLQGHAIYSRWQILFLAVGARNNSWPAVYIAKCTQANYSFKGYIVNTFLFHDLMKRDHVTETRQTSRRQKAAQG